MHKERYSSGVALLAVGITFAFRAGDTGCLIGLGIISPAALSNDCGVDC